MNDKQHCGGERKRETHRGKNAQWQIALQRVSSK